MSYSCIFLSHPINTTNASTHKNHLPHISGYHLPIINDTLFSNTKRNIDVFADLLDVCHIYVLCKTMCTWKLLHHVDKKTINPEWSVATPPPIVEVAARVHTSIKSSKSFVCLNWISLNEFKTDNRHELVHQLHQQCNETYTRWYYLITFCWKFSHDDTWLTRVLTQLLW